MKKARLYQQRNDPADIPWPKSGAKGMWVFECPCEARALRYWGFAAAYGTMLWHFHLYHRKASNG